MADDVLQFQFKKAEPSKKNKQMWPGKFKPFRQGEYTTKFWLFAVLILFWVILYGFHLVSIRLCHAKGGTPDFGKICLTDIPAIIGRPSRSSTLLKGDRPSSSSPNFASRQFFPMTHYQIAVRLVWKQCGASATFGFLLILHHWLCKATRCALVAALHLQQPR